MVLSYCIPCHNRIDDLVECLPSLVAAGAMSGPLEIVLVDYNNVRPIWPDVFKASYTHNVSIYRRTPTEPDVYQHLTSGAWYTKSRYTDKVATAAVTILIVEHNAALHYHMAHARNIALRSATGDYVTIGATDIHMRPNFFDVVRYKLLVNGSDFLQSQTTGYIGVITAPREYLIAIGGFDERFEFYGKEDRDILNRLHRCGLEEGFYSLDNIMTLKRTPRHQKVQNYRLPLSLQDMSARNKRVLDENDAKAAIVVNEGIEWGSLWQTPIVS